MEYKKLGKSDVLVSELILGCWAMGGDYFGATEDKSSLEALEVSYENGVNTFDTAEIYGDGRSERVVGEAARRIGRDKVRIISKVFKPSMSHDKMIKACEDSLQRLGTDYLDVYFLHYPVAEEEVTIQERMVSGSDGCAVTDQCEIWQNTGPRRHCLAAANPRDHGTDRRSEKRKTGSGELESRRLAIQ